MYTETSSMQRKIIPLTFIIIGIILILASIVVFFMWQSGSSHDNITSNTPNITSTPTTTEIPTISPTTKESIDPTDSITTTPSIIASTPSVTLTGPVKVKAMYAQGENPNDPNAPNSYKNLAYYVYRIFTTTRADYENFALEQTIKGPSEKDKAELYWFNPISLSGDSNCGGKDFILNMDYEGNKATFQFCRTLLSNGAGDDARVLTVVSSAIEQFFPAGSRPKIIILDKEGNCVGDMTGLNKCKN